MAAGKNEGSSGSDDPFHQRAFMSREIVEDHDVARFQGWGQFGLDIDLEHLPVHRAIGDKGGH